MFEHIPTITEDNLAVFKDKELDWVVNLMKRCCAKGTEMPDEVIDCACEELNQSNPYLVKAIRGAVYGVAGEIEDEVEEGLEWRAGLAALPGILAILRLIDRALQAQLLEVSLLSQQHSQEK